MTGGWGVGADVWGSCVVTRLSLQASVWRPTLRTRAGPSVIQVGASLMGGAWVMEGAEGIGRCGRGCLWNLATKGSGRKATVRNGEALRRLRCLLRCCCLQKQALRWRLLVLMAQVVERL